MNLSLIFLIKFLHLFLDAHLLFLVLFELFLLLRILLLFLLLDLSHQLVLIGINLVLRPWW